MESGVRERESLYMKVDLLAVGREVCGRMFVV